MISSLAPFPHQPTITFLKFTGEFKRGIPEKSEKKLMTDLSGTDERDRQRLDRPMRMEQQTWTLGLGSQRFRVNKEEILWR